MFDDDRGVLMKKLIIVVSLISCFFLYYIEQILEVSYVIKTSAKWIVFILIPILLDRFIDKKQVQKQFNKKGMVFGLLFGISSFIVIMAAYVFLKQFIDFQAIVQEMQTKSKITAENFIFIAIYITLGNSLIEEFFFRGFIFLNLKHLGSEKLAYLFSASLFAIYHIAIFQTWFTVPLTLLALFGLFTIAIIFNWLNTKTNTFINSWIVHILADLAIILIGFRLFGLL